MARRKKKISNSNPIHSKFYATVASHRFKAEEGEGAEEAPGEEGPFETPEDYDARQRGAYRRSGGRDLSKNERASIRMSQWHQTVPDNPRAARQAAYWQIRAEENVPPDVIGPTALAFDEQYQRVRVKKTDIDTAKRQQRAQTWQRERGVYRSPGGKRKPPATFIQEELPHEHKQWLQGQLNNPHSEFNEGLDIDTRQKTGKLTPGQRQRLARYTDALQQGESHTDALKRVRTTRLREDVGRPGGKGALVRSVRQSQAREVMEPRYSGRATKFQDVAPTHRGFEVGITAKHAPDMDTIKRAFPNLSEQELIQIQQSGTELISQELLANQKWAHETRRANLLGKQQGKEMAKPDRVTIFTTNVGHPAVSVPSDSLVGQYIIKKRGSILGGYGLPKSQLRGEFPNAVRDAHIVDIATGASVGVKGRQGVFNTTGFRVGRKASPGYGQTRPLGAQILYDRAGRPLYDSQGNIRYSEGATRPVDWTTPSLGFRVFLG